MTLSPESSTSMGLGKGCAVCYCKFEKFSQGFHFRETSHKGSFALCENKILGIWGNHEIVY